MWSDNLLLLLNYKPEFDSSLIELRLYINPIRNYNKLFWKFRIPPNGTC